MRGAWLCAMLVATLCVAAPCLAQGKPDGFPGNLFGVGGVAESTVKVETADPPKSQTPAGTTQVGPKGEKGDTGEAGTQGPQGPRGPAGPAGRTYAGARGAKSLRGATGKPGRDGRDSALVDYPGTSHDLWSYRNGGTRDQRTQWECIREAKRRDAGETRMRQEADEDIRRETKEGDEKVRNDLITTSLLLCLLVSAAFFCGARRFGR